MLGIRVRHDRVLKILATALPALLIVGCVQISILDRTATPDDQTLSAAFGVREEHDVAILAVEFDPPLDTLQKGSVDGNVTLRVAVENKGYRKESEVLVVARLVVSQTGEVLQQESQTAESLAPGEVRVLEFGRIVPALNGADYRGVRYRLEIAADPVPGEIRQANNRKNYEIRIAGK